MQLEVASHYMGCIIPSPIDLFPFHHSALNTCLPTFCGKDGLKKALMMVLLEIITVNTHHFRRHAREYWKKD